MTKLLYRWLLMLHPPEFRRRFGDEILCIIDQAGGNCPVRLADGIASLMRQWMLRTYLPVVLTAILGAAAQMILGGYLWLGLMHRVIAGRLARSIGTLTPEEARMYLLLIAGLITAAMLAVTVLAVWCVRVSARRMGSR